MRNRPLTRGQSSLNSGHSLGTPIQPATLQAAFTDNLDDIDETVDLLLDILSLALDECQRVGRTTGRIDSTLRVAETLISNVSQRSLDLHELVRKVGQQGGAA